MWRDRTTGPRSSNSGARHYRKKQTPDHFIAFQITNREILREMEQVQKSIVSKNASLLNAMTSVHKSHITLMVISLTDYHQKQRAKDALDLCASRLHSEYRNSPVVLDIAGMGSFGDRVIFAEVHGKDAKKGDVLQHAHDIVQASFEEYGIYTTDTRSHFTPHLTVAKTFTGPERLEVPMSFYDHFFGSESVTSIQLCSMKANEGYYDILHEVQFVSGPKPSSLSSPEKYLSYNDESVKDTEDVESATKGIERL
ncbi:A-kinase anchor protein 7-like [Pecten maximus]|uniref:A-kinase anchor protein 7-like n=1 Tax=Pecten maximus TaxID=6579 RepID=UPI001458FCD2|nr:A-kinase anchor protein 7-like [Pecten maximus]